MNLLTSFLSIFILTRSSTSITFNCQFIDIEFCPTCIHQCKAINLIITKQNQTVTKIFTNNKESENIKVLKIHDQIVHHMPMGLENFFPYLSILQVWSCGLREITQNNIKVHENLHELSLSGNEIEILESNLFEKNLKISKIDFSRNRLKNVGFNLLLPLENLIFADFYANDCINDGSRNQKFMIISNLRKFCKPTNEMLMNDIKNLNEEVKKLKTEIKICEKFNKNHRCNEDNENIVGIDSLFPFFFVNDENRI
ncbi:hypothetical protein PVAND_016575 [Polypedilum vanderplanki]|uniref:Leucine rich repeat protein n=1 Tax=Polypedilum vanderplanki TaxID=319348 RepID=A0A9J6BG68_POLVA|nr:hypothetical protein PVAND_016575 [Polypedilum vanderplanki]